MSSTFYAIKSNLPIEGIHWGLQFKAGVAVTEDAALAKKLLQKGYEVTCVSNQDEPNETNVEPPAPEPPAAPEPAPELEPESPEATPAEPSEQPEPPAPEPPAAPEPAPELARKAGKGR